MQNSSPLSTGFAAAAHVRLPCAVSAVLSLPAGGRVSLSLHRPSQPLQDICVAPGGAVLVVAGAAALDIAGEGIIRLPLPGWVPRMLAFHDHASGRQRSSQEQSQLPGCLPLPGPLDDSPGSRGWLIAHLASATPAFDRVADQWARGEIYQVVRFVLAHPHLNVQQLALRYGLSKAQFRRLSLKAFGRPLKEQLRLLRASRALQLHADTGASFTRVAGDLGFSSPSHFCNEIKSLLGKSPSSIFQSTRLP